LPGGLQQARLYLRDFQRGRFERRIVQQAVMDRCEMGGCRFEQTNLRGLQARLTGSPGQIFGSISSAKRFSGSAT